MEQRPAPWGFWATIGFSLIIVLVMGFSQIFAAVGFWLIKMPNSEPELDQFIRSLESNGMLLAVATCVAAPLVIGLSLLFAKLRKSITVREYLCFHGVVRKQLLMWSFLTLLLAGCSDLLTILLNRSIVPEFMLNAYSTATFAPLLWFAVVVVAPLSEEILFRGFLFKGIQYSKLGPIGAMTLASLAWAAMHIQYDLYGMVTVFVGGLLLGFARLKTNSIYTPIFMHALWSLIATIEVTVYLRLVS